MIRKNVSLIFLNKQSKKVSNREATRKKQILSGEDNFRPLTAQTIIAHAKTRAKKGKRPSMAYYGTANPREAYKKAIELVRNEKEIFHISDLLSIYHMRILALRGVIALYQGIHFLSDKRPLTCDLGSKELYKCLRRHLRSELPFLKEIVIPEISSMEEARQWITLLENEYGALHEVSRIKNSG